MWPALLPILGNILDKIIPDPEAAADAKLKALQMAQTGELAQLDADTKLALAQIDVNKAEAGTDLFRGGWRPFVGWICGLGLAVQFLVAPIATWIAALAGHPVVFPALDLSTLMSLLFGMLGLGYLRTTEKLQGKA